MTEGKILCVVGAPRSGKSFLVKKLAEHYAAKAFYEGEEIDFPDRIKEDISKNIRPLERVLWFRNKLIGNYNEALEIKEEGGYVISDIAYFAVDLYIDVLTQDSFEREILHALAKSDEHMYGMPDSIIHLISNEEKTKEFIQLGGREFDSGKNYYAEHVLPIEHAWKSYLKSNVNKDIVVEVNRSELDFNHPEDFQKIINMLRV